MSILEAGGKTNILIALLIFSGIIIFHELGHFLLAKKNGILVNEFSLGLGPTIFGKQIGETKFSLKLLPFGGACMMEGEDEASDNDRSFSGKSVWARISVVAAGPIFNFILAFLMAVVMLALIGYDKPVIYDVAKGFPAAEAGMLPGDQITKLNNKPIHIYREISAYNFFHNGATTEVEYVRNGEKKTVTLTPKLDEESGRLLFGFLGSGIREKGNILETLKYSAYEVNYWITTTFDSLKMLVRGKVKAKELSGPVGIVKTIGDTYEASKTDGSLYVLVNLLNIAILLSANLGVMNLLPLPALDGGRLVFLIIEAIRGKAIDPEKEGRIHFVGLLLLFGLMIFVVFNDIAKLIG